MNNEGDFYGVFLETAHPVKFMDTVEKVLKIDIEIPERLKETLTRDKVSIPIKDFADLKKYLLR